MEFMAEVQKASDSRYLDMAPRKTGKFFQIGTTVFLQKGLMALLYPVGQSVMVPSCALVAYGWFLVCHNTLCTLRNLDVKMRIQTGGTA